MEIISGDFQSTEEPEKEDETVEQARHRLEIERTGTAGKVVGGFSRPLGNFSRRLGRKVKLGG